MTSTRETQELLEEGSGARLGPPDPGRAPLKASVFERMAGANCALLPLFPYHDAGSIVPCGAILRGAPDAEFGHFFHFNTAEEVVVVFGAHKAMLATGQIYATQPLHGVNSFLRDPADPEAFALITITQHQAEEGDQNEAVIFRCMKCHQELLRFDYDATPQGAANHAPAAYGGSEDDHVAMFPTLWGGTEAAAAFDEERVRTCGKCGHVNDRYPIETWGWQRYVVQVRTANDSRRALDEAAKGER
ncbi:hypothetical protein [Actinomadura opuntiae]|uniref:hypothetical protein n=1 Tax=Actinomadura sp. OS1-43 TaxID=604315 RepID=UPI00255AA5C4|nr:hypothetical protein [Actinomadura sp. OS1-43]MDL4821804.1 hypothetical protein [Actinomadura sp. OS1-43]